MVLGTTVLPVPTNIGDLVQQGFLERAFHDGLVSAFLFRSEAEFAPVQQNTGTEFLMSRPGLLATVEDPVPVGNDPPTASPTYEQWYARIDRFGFSVYTHMPTSAVANSNLFLRNIHQLGIQAAQSLNRIPRNTLFKSYLSGQTTMVDAGIAADTTIHVSSVNGFTDVIITGTSIRPMAVSATTPLPVTIGIGAAAIARNVIGVAYDDPADVYGPGTLTLSAALGAGFAARTAVVSAYAPRVVRAGGGASVDALGAGDTAVLTDLSTCINYLRSQNVQPHDDGYYHGHVLPGGNDQLFADPVTIRLNTAQPQGDEFREGFIGEKFGCRFFMNNELPTRLNSGALTATSANAFYAKSIGSEIVNTGGVEVGRVLITGKGSLMELGLDESAYVSEAGITGKIGDFNINNNGIQVMTDRIRLILRAPINAFQDVVTATWSITCGFPVPTDQTAVTGAAKYKRAVIYEYAAA
jgi:hypothetical protein